MVGTSLAAWNLSRPDDKVLLAAAPLQIVQGDLAFFRPEGCVEYDAAGGIHSARIKGEVFMNNGDDALIVTTDFRVFVGSRSWDSIGEWRVLAGDRIRDISLSLTGEPGAPGSAQPIPRGITRCMLFIEKLETFVPPATGSPPLGPGAQLGIAYPYSVRTHCGVTIMQFDGRWWKVSPPLSEDPYNPPPGWDDNVERGTIRLLSHDQAEFRTSRGAVAKLVPTQTPKTDPFACE